MVHRREHLASFRTFGGGATSGRSQLRQGVTSIFSAPLPAVQKRIVAFAPFIAKMDLCQLELVVVPPLEKMLFADQGDFGGIREYAFE